MMRIFTVRSKPFIVAFFSLAICFTASFLTLEADAKKRRRRARPAASTSRVTEQHAPTQNEDDKLGEIEADLPIRIEKDKPFDIDVSLDPKAKDFTGTAQVFMEQTVAVTYEPRVFTLAVGDRKTVRATVQKTYSGVVGIRASASGWEELNRAIDTGFIAKLRPSVSEPIDSGLPKSFSLSFVDPQGNPVPVDAQLTLKLQGSNIKLKTAEDAAWKDQIEIKLKEGVSSASGLSIQSNSLTADKALISVQLETEDDFVIHNSDLWIDVKPRWFLPLLMAMLGGVLHGFYKVIKQPGDSWRDYISGKSLLAIIVGVVSGALAYLLANWDVLGIKVDTTSLQAFVILGFLFAYVGVDVILDNLTSRNPKQDETRDAMSVPS